MKHLLTLVLFLCLGTFASAQIPSYVPTNGLVGWWPFNGNANDESGNGRNGSIFGNLQSVNDRNGLSSSAFEWNNNTSGFGSNTYIRLPINDNLFFSEMSISVWVWKTNSPISDDPRVIGRGENGIIADRLSSSYKCFFGCGLSPTSSTPTESWVHLVFTSDCSTGISKFYINGLLANQNISTPSSVITDWSFGKNGAEWNVGRKSVGAYNGWGGKIDDIAIFNRALTAAEVQQLYSGQSACNLTVNLAPSDTLAACGNSITLNAGNPGANYLWNTGDSTQSISATQSGWYGVTVTQNNCSATDSVYVNLLQVDLGNDTTVCRGRSLQLTSKSIGNINNPLRLPSDSASLKQLGYITGPQGGPNCTVHTDTKWIKTLGVDYIGLFTVQHRFFDKSRIYNKQNQLIWEWAGESVPSTTWYGRKHQLFIGGNDSIRIEFYSGYPNFCVGSLAVTKLIFSTNFQSSTLWSTGDTTPTINVTPTQTTTYYCTVSDGISTCTDSVTVFVTQPPVLTLPDTLRSATRPVVLAPGNATTYL